MIIEKNNMIKTPGYKDFINDEDLFMVYKAQYSKLFLYMPMGFFLASFLVLFIKKYDEEMSFVYLFIGLFMALLWMISVLTIRYEIDDSYLKVYFWCFKKKVSFEIIGALQKVYTYKLNFAAPGENQVAIINKRNETILHISPLTLEKFISDFSTKTKLDIKNDEFEKTS